MQTFTRNELIAINITEKEESSFTESTEPSVQCLQNILNYSRNLEIRPSVYMKEFEIMKS